MLEGRRGGSADHQDVREAVAIEVTPLLDAIDAPRVAESDRGHRGASDDRTGEWTCDHHDPLVAELGDEQVVEPVAVEVSAVREQRVAVPGRVASHDRARILDAEHPRPSTVGGAPVAAETVAVVALLDAIEDEPVATG